MDRYAALRFFTVPAVYSLCLLVMAVGTTPVSAASKCIPTRSDSLGPYYISGMPVVDDLNRFGKPGDRLTVTGMVRSASKASEPVAAARIEIWQTDGQGDYHPESNGKYADYNDRELDLRGTVIADENGRFTFRTVIPGRYPPRPAHLHYRISADGYRTLVTQHYLRRGSSKAGGRCRSAIIDNGPDGTARFRSPDIFLRSK